MVAVEAMVVMIMGDTVGPQGARLPEVVVIIRLVGHLMEADQEEIDLDPYHTLHTGALTEAATVAVQMFMQGKWVDYLDQSWVCCG